MRNRVKIVVFFPGKLTKLKENRTDLQGRSDNCEVVSKRESREGGEGSAPMSTHVLLVHGVGSSKVQALEESVRHFLAKKEITGVEVLEYHWNSLVEQPLKDDDMNVDATYVGGVVRAIRNAALQPSGKASRSAMVLTRVIAHLIDLLPLLLVWKFMLIISNSSFAASFSFAHPFRSFGNSLMWASGEVLSKYFHIPAAIATSGTQFHLALSIWLGAIGIFAVMTFLLTRIAGCAAVDQMRRILLLVVSPFVALGIVLFAISLPLVAMGYGALLCVLTYPYSFALPEKVIFIAVGETMGLVIPSIIFLRLVLEKVVGPLIKVGADIFRYLSDYSYRQKLEDGLRKRVDELKLDALSRLIVVGHSLGSVVAVHFFLRNAAGLSSIGRLSFVTLGSPLVRFFYRFFPDFCPHPIVAMETIRKSTPNFEWVNVYRPWDPIGTSFGGAQPSPIRERSTRQWQKLLVAAHTDYWTDPVVLDAIEVQLTESSQEKPTSAASSVSEKQIQGWFGQSHDQGLPRRLAARLALAVTALITVWLYYSTLITVPRLDRESRIALVRRIDNDYVEEEATVKVERMDLPNPLDTSERYAVCGYTATYAVSNRPPLSSHFGHNRNCDDKPPTTVTVHYSRANPQEFYVLSEKDDPLPGRWVGNILLLTFYAWPVMGLLTFFCSRSALRVCLGIGGQKWRDPEPPRARQDRTWVHRPRLKRVSGGNLDH